MEERRVANKPERDVNWTMLFFYFFVVLHAFFGEFGTKLSLATFGFYYIVIAMPGWMVCWFAFLIFNEVHPVRRLWLHASVTIAVLAVIGYLNINP